MQLFTTQINDIQSQIEALQAERNRLQELENATAGALANLKAVVANVEGDALAIATLKNAVSDLFQSDPDAEEAVDENDEDREDEQPEFGTPDRPCPATTTGECSNPECEGETFTCEGCGKETPYCFGGDGDELCNDCWNKSQKIEPVETPGDKPEEKADPKFLHMFDGEPEPDDFNLVVYNDRVHRYENQIGIHFKLKREAKAWADQFEVKYHDCKIEIHKDDFESFGYVLKMTKGNPDDPQWWQEVTSFDYSKSPAENSLREKYHVLIQKNSESETVEIESSDEAIARKNYQHLVESIPYAYIHLMSNKRGCIESHKPAVQHELPKIESDNSDVLDLDEEWCPTCDGQGEVEYLEMVDGITDGRAVKCPECNGAAVIKKQKLDGDEPPTFSFIATGQGFEKVIHNGEVLGPIYSNNEGWELETGEQFETREEAAEALFNQTPSAA